VEQLGARKWAARSAAAAVLAAQGGAATEALIAGMDHPDWRVRRGCADLMDHLADHRCVAPLLRLARDPVVGVRRLALHALGCQGCKQCPLPVDPVAILVERVLGDPSIRVRRVAAHQLGCQPPDSRAAAALQTILQQDTDPGLQSRARWALAQHAATAR
jgi:HEAT repeat protein